jgi:alpha-galactosidase/6-phospho-beta-glucosidase family protein
VIEGLNVRLFADLGDGSRDPVDVYECYIAARDAGYMQIESGRPEPRVKSPWGELSGYDRIALNTVRGIHFNANAIIPLNVENRGNMPDLEDDDVVEVPCVVNGNGALPLHVGPVPEAARELLVAVKNYERRTVQAALTREPEQARRALAANPLVPDDATAGRLLKALRLA